MTTYTVYVVDGDNLGATIATIHTGSGEFDAQVDKITWVLNDHDAATLKIPVDHASVGSITEMSINSEIRIERDSTTVFWGIVTRTQLTASHLMVSCQGLTYYFEKRYVGDSARTNLLTNGDMELGTGWSENDPGTDIVMSYDTTYFKTGTQSLRILGDNRAADVRTNGDAIDSPIDPDDYHGTDNQVIQETAALFTGENFFHVVVCKAWFYIRDDGTYTYNGKPFDFRGFYIQTQLSNVWTGRHWYTRIDDTTARNEWIRVEFEILVYGGETVEIRLYWPGGSASPNSAIYWDSIGLYLEESLSFYGSSGTGSDILVIAEGLVDHAQGLTVLGQTGPSGKDDLNITGDPANSSIGTDLAIAYQHADHENIWEAIKSLTEIENGLDLRVSWNGVDTIRYIKFGRPLGSAKTTYNLQIDGASSNIIAITNYVRDGAPVANSITVLGDGSGPDREEAGASDTTDLGIAWEEVLRAPTGWDIDQLDEFAAGELASRKDTIETFTCTLTDSDFAAVIAGNLLPGDTVTINGTWGNINWTTRSMKLIRLTLDCASGVYTAEFNQA